MLVFVEGYSPNGIVYLKSKFPLTYTIFRSEALFFESVDAARESINQIYHNIVTDQNTTVNPNSITFIVYENGKEVNRIPYLSVED